MAMTVRMDEKFIKVRIADGTFCNNGFESVENKRKQVKCHRHGQYYQAALLAFIATNRMNAVIQAEPMVLAVLLVLWSTD